MKCQTCNGKGYKEVETYQHVPYGDTWARENLTERHYCPECLDKGLCPQCGLPLSSTGECELNWNIDEDTPGYKDLPQGCGWYLR